MLCLNYCMTEIRYGIRPALVAGRKRRRKEMRQYDL
jgi:hypothetical protein